MQLLWPPASVREEVSDDPTPTSVLEEDANTSMKKLKKCWVIVKRHNIDPRRLESIDNLPSSSSHPPFKNLKDDPYLKSIGPTIKADNSKNINKSDIIEKESIELREEILLIKPSGGPIPSATLAVTTNNLNHIIKHLDWSSKQLVTPLDQNPYENIISVDTDTSDTQHSVHALNQQPSASHKAAGAQTVSLPPVRLVDKVFKKSDLSKSRSETDLLKLITKPIPPQYYKPSHYKSTLHEDIDSDCDEEKEYHDNDNDNDDDNEEEDFINHINEEGAYDSHSNEKDNIIPIYPLPL